MVIMERSAVVLIVVIAIGLLVLNSIFFQVKETEQVVITQFGKPVRVIREAGLYAKIPDPVQSVRRFDKRLIIYDVKPSEFLTADKKNLILDVYMGWKIVDPIKFLASVRDRKMAEILLADVASAEVGAAVGNIPLSAMVSTVPEQVVVDSIMIEVSRNCRERALENYGIDVTHVKMQQLRLPEQNLESVFQRMRAERQRMAKKYRSEGEEEAMTIRAAADKEKRAILAQAYRESERIKGEGEAEAARIYSAAFSREQRFYKLVRTLQAYEKFLNDKTTVILSTDSDLLRLLKEGEPTR
jgi:membrane protease subunit HflC